MTTLASLVHRSLCVALASTVFLAAEQTASAQTLLAQSGFAKTMIGWLLVFLCIGLGLLVVGRPSGRRPADR